MSQSADAKEVPLAFGSEMERVEERSSELVVTRGDRAIDLELADHALDAVAVAIDAWLHQIAAERLGRGGKTGRLSARVR